MKLISDKNVKIIDLTSLTLKNYELLDILGAVKINDHILNIKLKTDIFDIQNEIEKQCKVNMRNKAVYLLLLLVKQKNNLISLLPKCIITYIIVNFI